MNIDEALFAEIKASQEDGVSSSDCAEQMELNLVDVNNVYSSGSFDNFRSKIISEYSLIEDEDKRKSVSKVGPAMSGYYKSLIAKKGIENNNLKEHRGWLMEQVSYLRKAVAFLELRKKELEDGIKGLEKNFVVGIDAMEQLEENQSFLQISEKTKKRNGG